MGGMGITRIENAAALRKAPARNTPPPLPRSNLRWIDTSDLATAKTMPLYALNQPWNTVNPAIPPTLTGLTFAWHPEHKELTPNPSESVVPGMIIDKRYQLKNLIAEGGMSKIFLAQDLELEKEIVLKIVRNGIDEYATSLVNEAKVHRSFAQAAPHLAPGFLGTNVDRATPRTRYLYIAMEYVPGRTLKAVMDAAKAGNEKLPLYKIIEIVMQLCGLHALHMKGTVHCDIKPANIIIQEDESLRLLDYGIAREIGHREAENVSGTPDYLSPEQADLKEVDQRADIYSLGLLFYEMLTGSNPMQADGFVDTILNQREKPLPKLKIASIENRIDPEKRETLRGKITDLSYRLRRILQDMTDKDPNGRYLSLKLLQRDLEKAHAFAKELAPYETFAAPGSETANSISAPTKNDLPPFPYPEIT